MELVQVVPGESSRKKSIWMHVDYNPKTANRFSKSKEKQFIPPTFVDLPLGLTPGEVDQFYREQRVDELARKLRANAPEMGDPDIRDPSPAPQYDRNGVRTNPREVRVRKKMEEEFARLNRWLAKRIVDYSPPGDLHRPSRIIKKLEIPSSNFPDVNFVAVIVGPRGIHHKYLQDESRCRIEFRGIDSSSDSQSYEESQLPLHVHIEGDTDEDMETAISLISPLLDPSSVEFRRARSGAADTLAVISGGRDSIRCSICQAQGHSAGSCPDATATIEHTYGQQIRCSICGGKGHLTIDCPQATSNASADPSPAGSPVAKPQLPPITIPTNIIGSFIGVQGSNIKRLMMETGCNIQVDQSKVGPTTTTCPLVFTGPTDAIVKAREACQAWIDMTIRAKEDKTGIYLQQRVLSGAAPGAFTDPDAAAQAVQMAYYQQMMWQAWAAQYGSQPPPQ